MGQLWKALQMLTVYESFFYYLYFCFLYVFMSINIITKITQFKDQSLQQSLNQSQTCLVFFELCMKTEHIKFGFQTPCVNKNQVLMSDSPFQTFTSAYILRYEISFKNKIVDFALMA